MVNSIKPSIHFFSQVVPFSLKNRKKLKDFLATLFRNEGKKLKSLNYIFCSDHTILEINRKYLNHDYYTDVIGFDLSDTLWIEAEIYISIERVRDNSRVFKTTLREELHRVIFHGALHFCGYTDKTEAGTREMRKKENQLVRKYFYQLKLEG